MSVIVSINGTDITTQNVYPESPIPAWLSAPASFRTIVNTAAKMRSYLSRVDQVPPIKLEIPIAIASAGTFTVANRQTAIDWLSGFYRQQVTVKIDDGTTARQLLCRMIDLEVSTVRWLGNPVCSGKISFIAADPLWRATANTTTVTAAVTNLCLQSQALDTGPWSANGATITANTTVAPNGTTTADTVARTAAAADGPLQGITFTGDGTKTASFYIKQGTSAAPHFSIYDTTAATDRCRVQVTWTGGVPVLLIFAGAGTVYTPIYAGNGWYRIAFSATGVLAANANIVIIYPSLFGANGDTIIVWGVQVENATTASGYIPTTTTTVTGGLLTPVLGTGPTEDWSLAITVAGGSDPRTITVAINGAVTLYLMSWTGTIGANTLTANADIASVYNGAVSSVALWNGGFPALDPANTGCAITVAASSGTASATLTHLPRYY